MLALSVVGGKNIYNINYILWGLINMPTLYYSDWVLYNNSNNKKLSHAIKWRRYHNFGMPFYLEANIQSLAEKKTLKSKLLLCYKKANITS